MAPPKLQEITRQEPPATPSFAFARTAVWDQADLSTHEAFEELVAFLGPKCEEIILPRDFDHAVGHLRRIMTADLAKSLTPYSDRGLDQISEILRSMIDEGNAVSAVAYNLSVDVRDQLNSWIGTLSNDFDAIITPATIGEAVLGLEATGDPVFCSTWSFLGVPAVTIPLMQGESGMPLGVQLVSARGDDARLLRTARWLAEAVTRDI
jgi:Asp-tRNA(Asn)/Glu-tRNA(Gln) amidotransferase A subunit family amidase